LSSRSRNTSEHQMRQILVRLAKKIEKVRRARRLRSKLFGRGKSEKGWCRRDTLA